MKFGGFINFARVSRVAVVAAALVGAGLGARTASADPAEAKKIFTQRCMACHTFGKGVKVGPDLKGVTERRQRPWLLKFIRSSASVIDSGDATAVGLFEQFKQQRMPDWIDLSEDQIGSILDWLGINGPEQQEPDARLAETATAAQLATGRQLFNGEVKLANGGTACASCHSIHDAQGASGGTLATDLSDAYSQYQDTAMTLFLKHPCVHRMPESANAVFLAPEESFAIKAYLRQAALANQSASPSRAATTVAKTIDGTNQGGALPTAGTTAPAVAAKRVAWSPKLADTTRRTRGALEGELLFLVFPYAALLVLLVGIGIRFAMARRQPDTIRAAATSAWQLFAGATLWRVGLAITLVLHLVGVLLPRSVLAWNAAPVRLYLLEGTGFLFGALALAGWLAVMRQHISRTTTSARATLSEIADCIFLSLLCTAIVSGLVTAIAYRWGSSWAASTLTPYVTSLARGTPQMPLIVEMPFLVRLHVASWFAVIALVPFTSAAMIVVALLDRGVMWINRPIHAIARGGRRAMARLSPARWLWPEEDALDNSVDNAQEHS